MSDGDRDRRPTGKVAVIGLPNAGKSTLIASLCRRPVNLEVRGRTVAMDHGMLELQNRRLSLVGVPGQPRFAPVQEALVAGAVATIWVRRFPWLPDRVTGALADRVAAPRILFLNQTVAEAPQRADLGDEAETVHAVIRGDLLAAEGSGREELLAALQTLPIRRTVAPSGESAGDPFGRAG